MSLPHPIPYQGSKRKLAPAVLARCPGDVDTLFEPFAGSAAVTLAAAQAGLARRYVINDVLAPLVGIWDLILGDPDDLADRYEALWHAQLGDRNAFYNEVRDQYNRDGDPAKLLYLLARCVKNAVRFNQDGAFNQSPDKRRKGTRPATMRKRFRAAHHLLKGRTRTASTDYAAVLRQATPRDLVYMDPPYQGTSQGRDPRYVDTLDVERFVAELHRLNERGIRYLVSFDGRTGDKTYGSDLPGELGLEKLEIVAGTSSQATLNGKRATTYESLYVSPTIAVERAPSSKPHRARPARQMALFGPSSDA